MTIRLFSGELALRDFGRAAVRIADLQEWLLQVRGVLPPTIPDVTHFEVVQLEELLCSIERGATAAYKDAHTAAVTAAARLVDPGEGFRGLIESGDRTACLWLIGADAHSQWRQQLAAAVESGALRTVDSVTMLPMSKTAGAEPPQPAPVAPARSKPEFYKALILGELTAMEYTLTALPPHPSGRSGLKGEVRNRLVPGKLSKSAFDSSWQALLDADAIKYKTR